MFNVYFDTIDDVDLSVNIYQQIQAIPDVNIIYSYDASSSFVDHNSTNPSKTTTCNPFDNVDVPVSIDA